MIKIAVLISGNGSNLQALIDAQNENRLKGSVVLTISNKAEAYGLERAKKHGIATHLIRANDSTGLLELLARYQIDLIVLAGYLAILKPLVIKAFQDRILNIHPSLLPKYSGKGFYGLKVHKAVIDNREKYSGCSVHLVNEGIDTGPILAQIKVTIDEDETAESLQQKVLVQEHKLLVEVVNSYINDYFKKGEVR